MSNKLINYIFTFGISALLISSCSSWLNNNFLIIDLLSHFRIQYLCISLFLSLFLLLTKNLRLSIFAFSVAMVNFYEILPYYTAVNRNHSENALQSENKIKIMVANVYTRNQNYDQVISLFKKQAPDILVVLEIDREWEKHLNLISDLFPHSLSKPQDDNFGIAIYSQHKPESVRIAKVGVTDAIIAKFTIKNKTFNLFGVHVLPPVNEQYFEGRNIAYAKLSDALAQLGESTILVGDLNSSMWSPAYRQFIHTSKLYNSRHGFGMLPTWPAHAPLLGIPIDHILYTLDWHTISLKTETVIGSDHKALMFEGL